jgi:hypothetical protein
MKKHAADNLLFLREQYPNLYNAVRNRTYDKTRVVPDAAKNGQPILKIVEGGRETAMYSRYDPGLEAARWAATLSRETGESGNLLLVGFGLGYHAAAILEAYPDRKLYIIEPDPDVFLAAIECVDLRPVLGSRQVALFAVGDDPAVLDGVLQSIYQSAAGAFAFAAPPYYRNRHGGLVEALAKRSAQTAPIFGATLNTIRRFRQESIENALINARRNLRTRSFRGLRDVCAGVPAVIAGSGPSLGLAIDKLRAIRDRVLLIASGSSIQGLLHHGLEPDLIVSIDPGEWNRRVFEKLDVSQIPFLYVPALKHSAIRDDRSPFLLHAYVDVDTLANYIMDPGDEDVILQTSTTVAGAAVQAAVWMGCRDIVFIGHDFSFPGDAVYAAGVSHAPEVLLKRRVADAELVVPNVAGGENRTNKAMLVLKHDTEDALAKLPFVRFYNASPVGAVIRHTEPLALDELPVRLKAEPRPAGWFKKLVLEKTSPPSPDRQRLAKQRIRKLQDRLGELEELHRDADRVLGEASAMLADPSQAGRLGDWFGTFEKHWQRLLDHDIVKRALAYYLAAEHTHARRHWPDMLAERDPLRKLEKLLFCVAPLMDAIRNVMPVMHRGLDVWRTED